MTTSPRLGFTDLEEGETVPETSVNEIARRLEQGAGHFTFVDRDLSTPPGSPSDGDCYLVAGTGTGAWAGHDGDIAYYASSAWSFIDPTPGLTAYVGDEAILIIRSASAWHQAGITDQWAPNFTSDANLYIPALNAMTVDQGNAKIGTGTITFEKSTAAAPSTFSSTTLPATLEAGAWLKVIATSVSGFVATHLKRTA